MCARLRFVISFLYHVFHSCGVIVLLSQVSLCFDLCIYIIYNIESHTESMNGVNVVGVSVERPQLILPAIVKNHHTRSCETTISIQTSPMMGFKVDPIIVSSK